MYAHQVINTIENHFTKNSEETSRLANSLIKAIKDSQMFHFGEANDIANIFKRKKSDDSFDIIKNSPFSDPIDSDLRLPYPRCWFDYVTDINTESYSKEQIKEVTRIMDELKLGVSTKKGYIVHEVIPESILCCISFSLGAKDKNFWSFTPIVYFISMGKNFSENPDSKAILFHKELPLWIHKYNVSPQAKNQWLSEMISAVPNIMPVPMTDPELTAEMVPPTIVSTDITNLMLIQESVQLLNCKNIITEVVDNTFKRKVGKKVKKVTSKKKFKYHVLNVTAPTSRKKYIKSKPTERTVRVHMCRGHYRHYIDKPLFGKYYGRFWIQDHVRGNKKEGFLHKEYNIIPNEEIQT